MLAPIEKSNFDLFPRKRPTPRKRHPSGDLRKQPYSASSPHLLHRTQESANIPRDLYKGKRTRSVTITVASPSGGGYVSEKTYVRPRRKSKSETEACPNINLSPTIKADSSKDDSNRKASPPLMHHRSRLRSDGSDLRRYIAERRLEQLTEQQQKHMNEVETKLFSSKKDLNGNESNSGSYYRSERTRSLSEGHLPLSTIEEEEDDQDNERKHSSGIFQRLWKRLKKISKHEYADE